MTDVTEHWIFFVCLVGEAAVLYVGFSDSLSLWWEPRRATVRWSGCCLERRGDLPGTGARRFGCLLVSLKTCSDFLAPRQPPLLAWLEHRAEALTTCALFIPLSRWLGRLFEMSPFEPWTTRDKVERVSMRMMNTCPGGCRAESRGDG